MTTKEILVKARELIRDPRCWKTGMLGCAREGSYCAVGAVLQIANGTTFDRGRHEHEALSELASLIDPSEAAFDPHHGTLILSGMKQEDDWARVVNYNNTKGHECVLNLFDAAIERQP